VIDFENVSCAYNPGITVIDELKFGGDEYPMLIEEGTKLHVIYRALYEKSTRRHFLGEIIKCDGVVCLLQGYEFVYDPKLETYQRKPERRRTIIDLAESGYVVNIIDPNVKLDDVSYKYSRETGMVATDGKSFSLGINEFGLRN
jgi:hypothetical protein